MANVQLGKVGLTPKDLWSSSLEYEKLDIVVYDGNSYIAKKNVPVGVSVTTGTEYWQLFSEKGNGMSVGKVISVTTTQPLEEENKLWIREGYDEEFDVLTPDDIDDTAGEEDTDKLWSADKNATNYKYTMKRLYRDTITDSKLLTSPGFYNVNTSSYTDLTADFGTGVYGILQVWSDPPYQKYQVFITETGIIATRWVKGDGTQAGDWQKIKINSLMKVQDRGSITDSKLLTSPGFYWINTSWFTDMSDLGTNIIGLLQDWSKPGNQRTQVFVSESGTVAMRWVKADGSNAGSWKIFSFDGMMTYRKRGTITDSKLLPSPGFYNVNSSWYTDLTADFGTGVYGILQTWSDPLYQKYQLFTSETGMIAYRVINASGTSVVTDWKYLRGKKQNFYYAAFGDSRCYGYTSGTGALNQYRYPKYIGDNLNINYGNYALSGSGLFARPNRNLPDALTVLQNNTTALQNNNVNLITIEYGVNDYEHPIGNYTDTGNDTWCGKLYNLIKYISETFPTAHLIVIGSANTTEGTQDNDYGYGYTISSGWSLGNLIKEEEKLCAKYHIPFISGFDGPFNNFNITEFMPDNIHFEDEGYLMRSRYLLGKIKSIVDFNNC